MPDPRQKPRWVRIWLSLERAADTLFLHAVIFGVILAVSIMYSMALRYYTGLNIDPAVLAVVGYFLVLALYAIYTLHTRAHAYAGGGR